MTVEAARADHDTQAMEAVDAAVGVEAAARVETASADREGNT